MHVVDRSATPPELTTIEVPRDLEATAHRDLGIFSPRSDWQVGEDLLRLAYENCREATGRFNSGYIDRILERWRLDGVDTVEKALAEKPAKKGKKSAGKETSFDLDAYESMVSEFTPVYKKN